MSNNNIPYKIYLSENENGMAGTDGVHRFGQY